MTRTTLALPFTLLALTATACVDESETELGGSEAWVKDGNNDPCPKLGCGSNSANMGPTEFHELEETGTQVNDEGMKLLGLYKNGVYYRPDVVGTVLYGRQLIGGSWVVTLQGAALVGAEFDVLDTNDPNPLTQHHRIQITKATSSQMAWQAPITPINTYELMWLPSGPSTIGPRNVCNNPPNRREADGSQWPNVTEAILFAGDRYDTTTLTVESTTDTGWFNIGCSGTVLAKLALNRHTTATRNSAAVTTWAQRQTMLKMYSADVCGHGDALTVTGTAIQWQSTTGLQSPPIAVNSYEARWNENGAICLTKHRLFGSSAWVWMQPQIVTSCAAAGRPMPAACGASSGVGYLRTVSSAL